MSFLSDAVANAKNQISVNVKGQVNTVTQGVNGAVQNAKNQVVTSAVNTVNNGVKTALGSAVSAVTQLATGNVSGALSTLSNAPSDIFSSAVSGLGSFGLDSGGSMFQSSFSNGIAPGNDLAGALARPDPMMTFLWYVQMPVINPTNLVGIGSDSGSLLGSLTSSAVGAVLGGPIGSTLGTPLANAVSNSIGSTVSSSTPSMGLPWYYVEGAQLPFRQFSTKTIFREGRDKKYPDKYSIGDLHLDIYADCKNEAMAYLQAWNSTVLSPFSPANASTVAGGWGRPSDYKKSILVYVLDVTKQVLLLIEYIEAWPTNLGDIQLESGASNRVIFKVPFSVGDVFITQMSVSPDVVQEAVLGKSNALGSAINSLGNTAFNAINSAVQTGVSTATNTAINSVKSSF